MLFFLLALLTEDANPLLRELHTEGVRLAPALQVPLPPFQMADGLGAAEQLAVLDKLPGRAVPVEELIRPSTVAPFVLKFTDYPTGQAAAPGRGVDLYFVAQGSLAALVQGDCLDRVLNSGRKDAAIEPLAPAELRRLGLTPAEGREGWAHVRVPLMDRVQLRGTNHTRWSRTAESIQVAARLDSRFTADRRFPNEWRLLRRDEEGKPQPDGAGQPYEAMAYTLKITELKNPAGMLFVEWHLVFSEPEAWFDGANLLRSKLPLVLQTKVRGFRRDLLHGSTGQP